MGAVERSGIRRCLERAGWNPGTPAAIITNASQPDQRVWIGTLATLDSPARRHACRRRGSHRHRPRGIARDGHTLQPSVRLGGDIMAAIDDPKTLGRARLSFAKESDIDEFADMLGKFERGDITPDQWRGFRLLRGTYGQRQTDDSHMMRLKAPQGMLTADQLYALAAVAEEYSRGFGHITTRQNIQLHFVKLNDAETVMRRIAEAGMTSREACGNSVRNITACAYAGVSASEPFDVTPYSEMMTRYFLRHPLSSSLPRKFKIGFEGCAEDHVKAAINDIGWLGRVENGRRGFRVLVGGGTATMSVSGHVLYEFLPVEEMLSVAEAIVRVFHGLGDYKHKHKNRMKFLMKSLGWDKWRAEFERALAEVKAEGGVPLPFDPATLPVEQAPSARSARAIGRGHRPPCRARDDAWPGDSSLGVAGGRRARRRTCAGPPRTCGTRNRPATSRPSSPCRSAISRASSSACWRTCRWPTAMGPCGSRRRRISCSGG